jgi:hypothetical protein
MIKVILLLIVEKLFAEKPEVLYEILLIYFSNFLNPINQNFDFFVKFFDYCALSILFF